MKKLAFIICLVLTSCIDYGSDGLEAFENGDYEEAERFFSSALVTSPENVAYHYNLARSYEELEKYSDAIIEYTWVASYSPNPSKALLGRGRCYWGKEDYESSIMDFKNVLRVSPEKFEATSLRGSANIKIWDYFSEYEDLETVKLCLETLWEELGYNDTPVKSFKLLDKELRRKGA